MLKKRKLFENLNRTSLWFITVALALFTVSAIRGMEFSPTPEFVSRHVQAANSSGYGAVTFASSLSKSGDKSVVASKVSGAGFGWAREEYTYPINDYAPYDSAYSKLKAENLQILGLLTYSAGISHVDWKNYVDKVVSHFPGVGAWEIMNEADNYLSPADYAVYLKEASEIIRGKGSATVICSGLGARKEVYPFWDGLNAAGAWGSFDAVGLHMFHDGSPFEDSYNNGIFSQEIQKVINTINNNGGGKSIWITEMGYDSNNYGSANQANWLVESLKIAQGFSEVNKVFVFRAYDHGNGLGLLSSDFNEKESYVAVKNWLLNGEAPAATPPVAEPEPAPAEENTNSEPEVIIPKPALDPEKSSLRLDGTSIIADSKAQYRIVVTMVDVDGNLILDRKPSINLSGGQTELTDFILVGNEWIAYVSSKEPGNRTAKIVLGSVNLGEMKMEFETNKSISTPTVPAIKSIWSNESYSRNVFFYICAGLGVMLLVGTLFFLRKRAIRLQTK